MASYREIIVLLGVCLVLIGGLSYWAGSNANNSTAKLDQNAKEITNPLTPKELEINNPDITNTMNPIAVLETTAGTVEIELFKNTMPVTAGNFEKLVKEGFYDGIKFHRVIDGFMIQGGDPITKTTDVARYGTGGPGYAIADEFVAGPLLTNTRGTIAMANSGPNTGGSQFFINLVDNTGLDFDKPPLSSSHPVFGRVVKGMDIVDAIAKVKVNERDMPITPVVITKATIVEASSTEATSTPEKK